MKPGNRNIDKTALISILTANHKDRKRFQKDSIKYNIQVSFLGSIILPPYLPCIEVYAEKSQRDLILRSLDKLAQEYEGCLSDLFLSDEEKNRLRGRIRRIGNLITKYLKHMEDILKSLHKVGVRDVIFYTDDYAIPWPWMGYMIEDTYIENPLQRNYDHLANRLSCGTLIVDSREDSIRRLQAFSRRFKSGIEGRDFNICLLQGVIKKDEGSKRSSQAYVRHLKKLFTDGIRKRNIEKNEVRVLSQKDWKKYSRKPKRLIYSFLNPHVVDAKIIHFTGHVVDGVLCLDEQTKVTPTHLFECLPNEFEYRPLVVLHGCSSGKIFDLEQWNKQLTTIFIDKGASGCLVALLPVDQPIFLKASQKSMIDLFYRKVVAENMPYGHALLEARHDFQRYEKTSGNPNSLFFNFYGDPRAQLFDPSTEQLSRSRTILKTIDKFEAKKNRSDDNIKKNTPEMKEQVTLAFENLSLGEISELDKELLIHGYRKIESEQASTLLGPEDLLLSPSMIALYSIIGAAGGAIVAKVGEKMAEKLAEIFIERVKNGLNRIFKKEGKKVRRVTKSKIESNAKQPKGYKRLSIGLCKESSGKITEWAIFEIIDDTVDVDKGDIT